MNQLSDTVNLIEYYKRTRSPKRMLRIDNNTYNGGNLGTVTFTKKRKKPYFVASRTGLLNASDAAKAQDAMFPYISNLVPNVFRGIDNILKGDYLGAGLEAAKAVGARYIPEILNGTIAAGDAVAATAAGQRLTSGLNFAANAIGKSKAWPWINTGLTSLFAAHGVDKIRRGDIHNVGDVVETGLDLLPLTLLVRPIVNTAGKIGNSVRETVNSAVNKFPWTYRIPENPNMAYRRMGPLEKDWIMEGNELSTRATNPLTEAEAKAAKTLTTKRGLTFKFFKVGAEHGGRKQFAKGQPWKGSTVTHGEEQVLAIPGEGLPWVSGRHYHGPQVGAVPFEDAPFGSHIDLLTKEGYSGVNPSLLDGSVIYSPFKIFGHKFGYKKLYPTNISTPRGILSNEPLIARGLQEIKITPEELYKFLLELKGYYFMGHGTGRTSPDPNIIFNTGLRIKNGDIGNTTYPVSGSNLSLWPHANSEEVIILPAKAESTMYDAAYGRIPSDWYDAKTFQWNDNPGFEGSGFFAVQKPNATFVETTVNGVPGVYTKPGAILGSYNTRTHTLRLNPRSQYKFLFDNSDTPEGLLSDRPLIARGVPEITAENAANITPAQWTAAQDAAIARGDMTEAQRLRDLHFKTYYPNSQVSTLRVYHGTTEPDFTVFDNSKKTVPNDKSIDFAHFFSDDENIASTYGKTKPYYINIENPYKYDFEGRTWRNEDWSGIVVMNDRNSEILGTFNSTKEANEFRNQFLKENPWAEEDYINVHEGMYKGTVGKNTDDQVIDALWNGNDGAIFSNIVDYGLPPKEKLTTFDFSKVNYPANDYVVFTPNNIKSANAVTYDNNGIRIPLGKRDNFKLNDTRYSWLAPFIGLGTLGTLSNRKQQ